MSLRLREIVRRALLARRVQAPRSTPRRVMLEALEERTLMTTSDPLAGFLTGPNAGRPIDIATSYLAQNGDIYGFSAGDAPRVIVTDEYAASPSGTTHLHLQQGYNGIGVENARISIAISRIGEVMFVGGDFVRGLGNSPSQDAPPRPTLSAAAAIETAAAQLGLAATGPILVASEPGGFNQAGVYTYPGVSDEPIPVRLDYVNVGGAARLVWAIHFATPAQIEYYEYDVRVDGETGAIVDLANWVSHADGSSFNVFALPGTGPSTTSRTILSDPSNTTASPFGWFDSDGIPGAESTLTIGNNVNAYADPNGTGPATGLRPNGGTGLDFDSPIDPTLDPNTYYDASTTQLFYLNNVLHDIHYQYGFDEASGNFQASNYGKGGAGNDSVRAADSFGSLTGNFDNATFATLPDGRAPTMRMFLWTQTNPRRSSSLDSVIVAHEYGHGISTRLTGGASTSNGLSAIQSRGMGEGWSDFWGLMLTQVAGDDAAAARSIGAYSFGVNEGDRSFRNFPTSYDLNIDPQSIGQFNANQAVHATGEIWASALWDMNILLRAKYGFNPDLMAGYTGEGSAGNILALQLVMDGLKLQPSDPSFSDARNAVLMADTALTGGQNQFEIWTAFARRGMGFSLDDGVDSDSTVVVEAFDMPRKVFVQPVAKISANELETIDTKIAEFYDGSIITNARVPVIPVITNYTVSINWGDGTAATSGQIVPNARGGFDLLAIGKVFDEGGNYTITITATNKTNTSTGMGTLLGEIADAPLVASLAADIAGLEGTAKGFTFGSFLDTDPHNPALPASSYKVTVAWGDGTSSTGSVVAIPNLSKQFTIVATNAYPRFGDYTYVATVTARGGASASYSGTATVGDAPLNAGLTPAGFQPVEGKFFSGNVATFVDSNSFGLLSDLSASIAWGDGRVTPGLVLKNPQQVAGFLVSGSNKYARFGTYNYRITISSIGGSSLVIPGTVVVADAPIAAQGTSFGLVEGQTFNGVTNGQPVPGLIATLSDQNPVGTIADFTGTINWGDGTPIDAAVFSPGGAGSFLVKGTHRYNQEGKFTINVLVTSVGGNTTATTSTATIANASLSGSIVGLGPLSSVEGKAFAGTVATFVDGNPTELLSDFAVGIDWGDGSPTDVGTISQPVAGGPYRVAGSHTYFAFGAYTISTTLLDDGVPPAQAATALPITVADAPIQAAGFDFLVGAEGVAFTQAVATFTDANPQPLLSDFTATINWGDGTSSIGTIKFNPLNGTFDVAGNHIYATQLAPYAATVVIVSAGGSSQTVVSNISIPNGVLTTTPVALSPTPQEGVRFNALITTFTDTNPSPKPGEYTATIFWGDGTSSGGVILANQNRFDVRGTHLYLAGDFNIVIEITDAAGGTAEAHGSITVNAAGLTAGAFGALKSTEGERFTDPVASFISANPLADVRDFRATINWGDDSSDDLGTIIPAGIGGAFTVAGSHVFRHGAGQKITVTVESTGGASDQVVSTIDVADAPLKAFAARPTAGVGQDATIRLAQLIDGAGASSRSTDLSVAITWGDGTSSAGFLLAEGVGTYGVYGRHIFTNSGSFQTTVAIADIGGSAANVATPVVVSPATITATFSPFGSQEKSPFAGDVAAFTTVNLLAGPADFSASINWGDGAITQGAITPQGGGRFTISGTHTYANSGAAVVGVVIRSSEGVSAFATGGVEVTDRFVPVEGGSGGVGGLPPGAVSSNNRPVFAGTAEVGDTVTLTAFRAGLAAPVVIGQVAVAADGTWTVTSLPLLDGAYTVNASAADFLGRPSSDNQPFASFTIDTIAPRITGVSLNPRLGKVFITFQDDRSGLVESTLADRANYALLRGAAAVPIRGITISPGGGSDARVVTLDVALGKAKGRSQKFTLSIAGSNFTDLGGNVLSEQFFLAKPNSTKNGYIAQLISDGRTIAGPQSIQVSKAAKPKPSRFARAGR